MSGSRQIIGAELTLAGAQKPWPILASPLLSQSESKMRSLKSLCQKHLADGLRAERTAETESLAPLGAEIVFDGGIQSLTGNKYGFPAKPS